MPVNWFFRFHFYGRTSQGSGQTKHPPLSASCLSIVSQQCLSCLSDQLSAYSPAEWQWTAKYTQKVSEQKYFPLENSNTPPMSSVSFKPRLPPCFGATSPLTKLPACNPELLTGLHYCEVILHLGSTDLLGIWKIQPPHNWAHWVSN